MCRLFRLTCHFEMEYMGFISFAHLFEDLFWTKIQLHSFRQRHISKKFTIEISQADQAHIKTFGQGQSFLVEDSGYPYQAAVVNEVVMNIENNSSQLNKPLDGLRSLSLDTNAESMSLLAKMFLSAPWTMKTILLYVIPPMRPVSYALKKVFHSTCFNSLFETAQKISGLRHHRQLLHYQENWAHSVTDKNFCSLRQLILEIKEKRIGNFVFRFHTRHSCIKSKFIATRSPPIFPRIVMASFIGSSTSNGNTWCPRGFLQCDHFITFSAHFCTVMTSSPTLPCFWREQSGIAT